MESVVAVVADLKSSTIMGTGKRAASTASIYEAGTGGVVKIFDRFRADYIQIQGDGAFAIFWGEKAFERAICSGITVKTMSEDFANQFENKWPNGPQTGFKIGVSSGRVLVKRVGTSRKLVQQEPVWAGKPVNYATKAAQCADRHELIVTESVWSHIKTNDYLAFSCDCGGGPSSRIWADYEILKLPDTDTERHGQKLSSAWCTQHGEEYCTAVLDGRTNRSGVQSLRHRQALQAVKDQNNNQTRSRKNGLRNV